MINKSDTKNEVIEKMIKTKEITICLLFSDFSTYPNLAVKLQRLIMENKIKIVDVKLTQYIIRGMEHLIKSIFK